MSEDGSKTANLSPAKQALLERLRQRAKLSVVPVIQPTEGRTSAPLSFAQQRLWLIQQLDPESYLYNVPRALYLRGPLDVAALEASLNAIIERHEILRTTFPEDEHGQPQQKIAAHLTIRLANTDLSSVPAERRQALIQEEVMRFSQSAFHLATGPLIRAKLLSFAEDEHALALVMHHIISDGWTGGVFFHELGELYSASVRGVSPHLPELPAQYADYAIWQREWMQGPVLENELKFWRTYLDRAPQFLDIPTDRRRPEQLSYRGGNRSLSLGSAATNQLKELCRQEGATLFPAMLVALYVLLSKWSGQDDLVVGTVSANRDQKEIENLIGCFMNFLPLRTRVDSGESAIELFRRVKQDFFQAFAHQNCPFEKIVEAVRPQRSLNVNPLYNVALLVQNYPEMAFRTDALEARLLKLEEGVSVLDLRFIAEEMSSGISLDCEYNEDLFGAATVDKLLRGYVAVLEQMAARPQILVSEIVIPAALTQQAEVARTRDRERPITIAATFTAEPVESTLAFWMKELGVSEKISFAPYNQVFQQLLDRESLVSRNADGVSIVLLRLTDWIRTQDVAQAREEIRRNSTEFFDALRVRAQHSNSPLLVSICPPPRSLSASADWGALLDEAEQAFAARLQAFPGTQVVMWRSVLELYPVVEYVDEYAEKLGRIPYSADFFVALGTVLARHIARLRSVSKKVIVLDGDGTPDRSVPNSPLSRSSRALDEFLLEQIEAGKMLCLLSERSQAEIDAGFDSDPGQLLRPEHVIAQRLGVDSIAAGLRELADELQIGLDEFVYITQSASKSSAVETDCPQVVVLLLPPNPQTTNSFLKHVWVLDSAPMLEGSPDLAIDQRMVGRIAFELTDVASISRAMAAKHRDVLRREFVAPRAPIEEMVAGIWAEVLKLDRVSIHDDFFALGGHSVLATQVVARVRKTFGVNLALRALFECPTLARFTERIESTRRSGRQLPAPQIERLTHRERLPLSFAQQRLWFLDQMEEGGSPFYNMPRVVRMRGQLDVGALHRTLNKIVERHESLRTSFAIEGSAPYQVIASKLELPLPLIDLTGLPEAQREQRAQELAEEEGQRAFKLSTGPVMRAQVLRLKPQEHILLWTMHHIVSDRWSMGVVAEELAAHYSAFVKGEASPLPELAIQYADFAVWQRQWLQGEVLGNQLDYWKKQLSGAPPLLELPTDRARPPELSVRGGTQSVLLSREFIEELTSFSQREGATLFMTLLTVFETLLWRYSGQEDVVIGSPIANRTFAEIEPLIGFFVNTLALRGDLSGDPTFRELLARTKEVCLEAYANQDIPFERLVEELQPERSLSHTPIFQAMFALQNAPMQQMELPGLIMERMPTTTGTSMFDMSWFVNEVAEGFQLYVEYAADLFEPATIGRALAHFEMLLGSAVTNPERRISELEILAPAEREKVLSDFNDTAADFPRLCIHQLMEASAERSPDSIAMICGDERMTYRELNERANQIGHHLIGLGAGPDVLVGVFMERTPDLVPAILGVLKSGSAYVPLDPSYPRERLQAILGDSKAPLVVTQKSLYGQLESASAKFVCVDSDWQEIARESRDNPLTAVTPDNLAYVLFTSGSTGRPKGVALEHHNNVTFVEWAQTVFTREELAGVLFCTSIGFDMSTFEMFITLAAGGKVILAENALYLSALPAKDEVTLINTVPSAIAELVRMNALPQSLTTVALAGEALPDSLVEEIYRTGTVKKVYNLYGPTESGYSTWTLVARGSRVTIGKPISNEQCYILDKNLHPLPIGVPGELYLAGEGLARGYFGRPDLTAERFVRNPFSTQKTARMYKTGDLCRWLPEGNIEYLGRIDHQIKLRGFRIELGEIESVLSKHSGVRQCLVMACQDEMGTTRLVAYFVAQEGADPSSDELAGHLKQSLPEYMIPSAFLVLDAFPLTPNGKIDRKRLPAPDYQQNAGEGYVAPRTPTEEKVAAIWAEVLHLDRVGATDDFFAIGGHSLLAAQVISRLRQALEIEIPLKAMFESPKLEVLAARIQQAKHGLELPAITRVGRGEPLAASFAQQRLWFLDQLEPNNPAYNIPWTLKIGGRVHVDALHESLNAIAVRHESLRTVFRTVGDQPVQVILDSVEVPFRNIDLTHLPEHERDAEAMRLIGKDANTPFDLSQAPLARFTYIRLGEEDHYLLLNVHHIISDRWSMGILSQELAYLYEAALEGKGAELPALPLQYADYSEWQRQWLEGEPLETQLKYWREKLQGVPSHLDLPTDRPRQATESFNGDATYISLSRELTDKLKELGRQHGATLFMTLLAGLQAVLARHSGQDDVVVGTAIANRTHPDLEKVIGFFLNTLPLRIRLDGDPTFVELLARAKETSLGAYAHQDMPFEKLVEALNPERSLSHSPLVQVFFVLQNAPVEALELKGLRLKPVPSGFKTVKGDMYLSMHESPEGLEGRLEYSTDLFDLATVDGLLQHLRVLLEAAARNPELKLSQLPLLTSEERHEILVNWNNTASEYPRDLSTHQLFEKQAAQAPGRIAATFEHQEITYGELNARSNQLAHYLRGLGVGPDTLVGIYVERSLEMLVALLGTMKAGGAYIPLDPSYPQERIAFILEDANAAVLLTQESLLSTAPVSSRRTVCLDSDGPAISCESSENLTPVATSRDLAYVLYTSGSTGKPKGVQIEHRNLVNFLVSVQREPGMLADDALLAVTTLSFDIAGLELYLPLISGARIVLASREETADGHRLLARLEKCRPTIMQATPATWRMLIDAGWSATPDMKVLCGGEALPTDLAAQLWPRCAELWNMYGPTETTIWSSLYRVRGDLTGSAPIGRPLANQAMYVLDAHLQPVPAGVTGELFIGGDGVARGYFKRAELTDEKFIADPFARRTNARLYRTGDLAKFLPDGNVVYLGRTDFQVKIRGFRIELGEIESAIGQHPAVRQVVVSAREDKPGDKRLVAYVVVQPGQHLSATDARVFVKQRLPEYMVPSAVVELESLPLTPNGKIDRKRLPAPDYGLLDSSKKGSKPRTAIEEIVAGIWAEVLKAEDLSIDSDFFELGGHSLIATQVVSRVRQAFQVQMPLRTMFEAPTIAALAERIEAMLRQKQGASAEHAIAAVPRTGLLPLSFAQQRLWFLDQLEPGNPLYNIAYVTRIAGPLNLQALEWSLNGIVRRHESLRTSFRTVSDQPVQVIAPHLEIKLAIADASHLPGLEARERQARKLATEEIQQPFHLTTGPLVRGVLIKIGDDDHALILSTHHIISDRWSLGVLSQEMAALYEANIAGKPSPLAELEFQYADYAVWQREVFSGEMLEKQLAYWRHQLEGAPAVLELPTDRPRKATEQFWGAIHRQPIRADVSAALKKVSRSQRGTLFMALAAAFELLLSKWSGQNDVVIGTDLANRNQLETEKMIGFFVNLLPMRARINPEMSFTEFFRQVRETSLEAMAHQDIPFDKLVEELRPERSLTHNPLVQVLFVMQNTLPFASEFGGLKLGALGIGGSSRFDLVLFINDPDTEPSTAWVYNPNLFAASTMARIADTYELLLTRIGQDPSVKIAGLFAAVEEFEQQRRSDEQKKFQDVGREKLRAVRRKPSQV